MITSIITETTEEVIYIFENLGSDRNFLAELRNIKDHTYNFPWIWKYDDNLTINLYKECGELLSGSYEKIPVEEICQSIMDKLDKSIHIYSIVSDKVLKSIKLERPNEKNKNLFFIGFSPEDYKIGTIFENDTNELTLYKCYLNGWDKEVDCIPRGWKTICLMEFKNTVNIPINHSWYDTLRRGIRVYAKENDV